MSTHGGRMERGREGDRKEGRRSQVLHIEPATKDSYRTRTKEGNEGRVEGAEVVRLLRKGRQG